VAKPFDASAKKLVDYDPVAFLKLAGLPGERAEIVDSDMKTVELAAGRLMQVLEPRYLAHFEFQAQYDPTVARRARSYNLHADDKYDQEVYSNIVLLREAADGPAMTGTFQRPCLSFNYHVIRLWELAPEMLLTGPPALWPLAPIANVPKADVPAVIRRIGEQVVSDVPVGDQEFVWTETYFILGLKYKRTELQESIKGVLAMIDMRESDTYLAVLEEGEERGLERGREQGQLVGKEGLVERQIRRRIGAVPPAALARIGRLSSQQLDDLGEALLDFATAADLDDWLARNR
jgi:predicted transposase YdaD